MFTLTETKPYSRRVSDTTTVSSYDTTVSAEWRFDDGVKVTMMERGRKTWYVNYGHRSRIDRTSDREFDKKPRLYVSDQRPFNVIEDLTNRTRRPHSIYRPHVAEALARIGLEGTKFSWSQNAGCSSCPCSPGFILELPGVRADFYVTIPDLPMVDETKPGRILAA